MDADTKRRAANILETCFTLGNADYLLADLFADRFTRFALWDGWSQRPLTLAGLVPTTMESPEDWMKYRELYGIGRELKRKKSRRN